MKKYIIILTLFFNLVMVSQEISSELPSIVQPHPTISSLLSFTQTPVNSFTGVPDISLPLASLSTNSKNINLNVSLKYHPASVKPELKSSDVGMGWNLFAGGSISIVRDRLFDMCNDLSHFNKKDDTYSYNFMGYSGRFKIIKENGIYKVVQLDETDLKIDFLMDSAVLNPNGAYFVEPLHFKAYDNKGFSYLFDIYDEKTEKFILNYCTPTGTEQAPIQYCGVKYRPTFHLTKIYDNNNNLLVQFNYNTTVRTEGVIVNQPGMQKYNKLASIESLGFGKVYFNFSLLENLPADYPDDGFQLNEVSIKDKNDNLIKKYTLHYGVFTHLKIKRILTEIKEFDKIATNFLSTKLYYHSPTVINYSYGCSGELDYGVDYFGYLNLKNKNHPLHPNTVSEELTYDFHPNQIEPGALNFGVLSQISYPNKSSVLYEFEANTLSYVQNDFVEVDPLDPSFYFNNDLFQWTNNRYNEEINTYQATEYNTANSSNFTFTVTGTEEKSLYFSFTHEPYYSEAHTDPTEPLIPIYTITGNDYNYNFSISNWETGIDNYHPCYGKRLKLQPGTYTIHIGVMPGSSTTGTITINEKVPVYPIQEYVFGAGMRIKRIAHYNDANIHYFYDSTTPVQTVSYDYSEFNNTARSSGRNYKFYIYNNNNTQFFTLNDIENPVYYHNIKITNSNSNGYIKETYYNYNDNPPANPSNVDLLTSLKYFSYKNGLLAKREIFDLSHKKYTEENMAYDFEIDFNNLCWAKLTSKTTKNYFYPNGGSTPKIVESNETFTYNSLNKQIASHTVDNSVGDILTTNYFYHTGNSIFSQNRIAEIERIETKRGSELLSESKINYSNTFANNASYLPSTIEVKKGSSASEVRLKNNVYDEFGHVLEVQQESGMKISYIYGYNKSQPVAKIENIAYSAIPANLITDIQNASNGTNEQTLLTALAALRNDNALTNAMVTTITYKPLIGVSTMTDPKGDKITYHYDSFNRLEFVKDKDGNILSENAYHYKN